MTETDDGRPLRNVPWDTPYDHLNNADLPPAIRVAAKRLVDRYHGWKYGEGSPSATAAAAAYVVARRMGANLTQSDIGAVIGCSNIAIRNNRDKIEEQVPGEDIQDAIGPDTADRGVVSDD